MASQGARKAGDLAMKTTVAVLFVATLGLAGSTFSQLGYLVGRRFGWNKDAPKAIDNQAGPSQVGTAQPK